MSPSATPQTLTTMEACMKLAPKTVAAFSKAQERMGAVVAAQPGFLAVIGGPIANSSWEYFCGKFETPEMMNQWYDSPQHKPVMDKAHEAWFNAFYIRKWRLPADGEELTGPLFLETAIVPSAQLTQDTVDDVVARLTRTLPQFNAMPFETVSGEFEDQPFQFVGPLEEFPQPAPVRYLLLTHWESSAELDAWLNSSEIRNLAELGEISHEVSVLLRHQPGERDGLNADGSQRHWVRAGTT